MTEEEIQVESKVAVAQPRVRDECQRLTVQTFLEAANDERLETQAQRNDTLLTTKH